MKTPYRQHLSIVGCFLLIFLWQSPPGDVPPERQGDRNRPPVVTYCDLVKNPTRFDGKEVIVQATYRYGSEWQELLCLECPEAGKTWLEFAALTADSEAALRQAPDGDKGGTINAVFRGLFQSSKRRYGHLNGYRYQLVVTAISNVEVIAQSGWAIESLPIESRRKVCGAATATAKQRP